MTLKINRMLVPFLWLFSATILIKIDGQEGFYPLFRVAVFAALPFALYHIWRILLAVKFTLLRWVELLCLAYLAIYPFMTMAFGVPDPRSLKDAAYTLSVYAIIFFLIRRYFTGARGELDVASLGTFWVAFAMVHTAIALLFWSGLEVALGGRLDFSQKDWLDGRLHGLLGTPSHLAPAIAIAALFLLAQPTTALRTFALAFLFVGLLMTGSRSGLIGFFAAAAFPVLIWVPRPRVSVAKICQLLFAAVLVCAIGVYFIDQATAILQIAFRVDPAGWEKSRTVMWGARLSEFYERGAVVQLFGAGHRSQGQTFNINVEHLVNYGLVYAVAFNAFYLWMVLRSLVRALAHPTADNSFMLMTAVFAYVFLQGLNPVLSAFVSGIQFALVSLLLRHFEPIAVRTRPSVETDTYPALTIHTQTAN
jgi:hypothetical protein